MSKRLLTPSKITAWLDCAHFLTLRNEVETGLRDDPKPTPGAFSELVMAKGMLHETECLASYKAEGLSVYEVPGRAEKESFERWVARVGNPFDDGHDVVFQMPFIHDGMRGVADFLERDKETGVYEPVDAKLARKEAKPGHVLQLCFYADALESLTGQAPRRLHLWLGSGAREVLVAEEFRAYWRRLRGQLARVMLDDSARDETEPEPCDHCQFCEFEQACESEWREKDSLVYVTGIRRTDRDALKVGGVDTLAALADRADTDPAAETDPSSGPVPVADVRPERLVRLTDQAALQAKARETPDDKPPFRLVEPGEDPVWGQGFATLPEPDAGDVFLDFEGHPFWRPDRGLFFLFGYIQRSGADASGPWEYHEIWAHTPDEERAAVVELLDRLDARRLQHPDMHVYHYNHTERSELQRLTAEYGVGELTMDRLVREGFFVDLYPAVTNALQAGVESYSLKQVELLAGYERDHEIDKGAGAVVAYEEFMKTATEPAEGRSLLDQIAVYNADDVRATLAVRDWLLTHRPTDLPWRAAVLPQEEDEKKKEKYAEIEELTERLHEFEVNSAEHLMGDLLGYWRREQQAYMAPKLVQLNEGDHTKHFDSPTALTGLVAEGEIERLGKRGTPITPLMRFRVPPQVMGDFRTKANKAFALDAEGEVGYLSIDNSDLDDDLGGSIDLVWNDKARDLGLLPATVVADDWIGPDPKLAALAALAGHLLDSSLEQAHPATHALLKSEKPRFVADSGPAGGAFVSDVPAMAAWIGDIDGSYVAVQGPPGTGKTYRGAHLIRELLLAGKRVGISAMSYKAIDNLLEATIEVLREKGELDEMRCIRKVKQSDRSEIAHVKTTRSNGPTIRPQYNLVTGTTWLFARDDMADNPVDVLVIDEAGQLSLADALAASRSAKSVLLLGDPLQLAQVAQATHPHGSGASVLEHVLGEHVTIPADRGVFLEETWRMHPGVCGFISEQIYESRLGHHANCEQQTTAFGTGLRWLRATHSGRSTESPEETALVVAKVRELLGTPWTDFEGVERPITADDVMVVAPFNDQVNLLRATLDADEATRGVPVGTVDKFQGGEAAVVLFSMATSSGDDMTRGADFLFSRNRLNVAISRARCLAYLVCTEELLDTRARKVEDMRLLSTFSAFVERCEG